MLKKLLAILGIGLTSSGAATAAEFHRPYAEFPLNFVYNLLFCDDLSLFKTGEGAQDGDPWTTLLADAPDEAALRAIAGDDRLEGRVRVLAYNRLRAGGSPVPPREVFGVIVEVGLEQGLDVLAAFREGGVRYLNRSGKVLVLEGRDHPLADQARDLVSASRPIIDAIGPSDKPRLPPPKTGNARITFLVSDGLYFGEGPFEALSQDRLAGPLLLEATQLLQRAVELGTK